MIKGNMIKGNMSIRLFRDFIVLNLLISSRITVFTLKCWDCTTDENLDPYNTEYCGESFDAYNLRSYAKKQNVIVECDCLLPHSVWISKPETQVFCQEFIKVVEDKSPIITRSCSYGILDPAIFNNITGEYDCHLYGHPYLNISLPTKCRACTTDSCNSAELEWAAVHTILMLIVALIIIN